MARRLLLVLLAAFLPACYSWQPVLSPEAIIRDQRPMAVRLTSMDGTRMSLRNPSSSNDSIVGYADSEVMRVAWNEVDLLEVPRFSFAKTGVLVVAHAGVIVGLIAAIIRIQPHYHGF